MPSKIDFDISELPQYLNYYYKKLFPYKQYYKWLTYGEDPKVLFTKREFSFTLENDIYIRYLSFADQEDMEEAIKKKCPHKIDIGAIYNTHPKEHKRASVFHAKSKELVFDIDMTDYDEVRTCCSGAEICNKCWKFMTIAVKILDAALRMDFGYHNILWVYSGRRGIHCWVCDAKARELSHSSRSTLGEYLVLIKGGAQTTKKVFLPNKLHTSVKRAASIAEKYFVEVVMEDQDMLGTPERWKKFLGTIPDQKFREALEPLMLKCSTSSQRWSLIQREINRAMSKGEKFNLKKNLVTEIILQYTYPRLDINVTKGLNHLLKSPFSLHPKTGRVCVCFNPQKADSFDPLAVPRISELLNEIEEYDEKNGKTDIEAYKKTSLKISVGIFESFLAKLNKDNANQQTINKDERMLEF